MARWIEDIQGYREILDADGEPVQRRKTFQVIGATVTDNGEWTEIEVPAGATGATGATGPTGATGAALLDLDTCVIRDDFLGVSPASLTADGQFYSEGGPWTFDLIAGTAEVTQRTTLEKNHPGQLAIAVGPTNGEVSIAYGDSSRNILWSNFKKVTWVYRTSATFSSVVVEFGIANAANTPNTSSVAAFFQADPATNANWRAQTRDGSTGTANVDTGVAITGSTYQVFEIERNTSTNDLTFRINGSTVATVVAATHSIDQADEFKLCAYCDNNNAGVTNQIYDLVLLELITDLDRTVA